MQLNEYPYWPYPSDPLTRLGFIVGDIVAFTLIIGIIVIALRATLHF
jgi:hypothetical protein